jgi:hypothetical protein
VQSGLPSLLWAEAVSYVVYTKNRLPHRAINDVPERLWSGKAPGVAHLRPFGCRAWKYVAEPHQRAVKLAPRGLARIFVGYSADHMAYRLWDPSTCKVELARDVQFFENVFPAAGDRSDAQELSFDVISFPEEGSQQRGDSADGSAPSNPPESVQDDSEHFVELPAAPEAPAAPPAPPITPAARPAPSAPPHRPRAPPAAPAAPPPAQHCLQRLFRADPEHFLPAEHLVPAPAPPIAPERAPRAPAPAPAAPAPAPAVSSAAITPPRAPAPQQAPAAPRPISRVHSERIENTPSSSSA